MKAMNDQADQTLPGGNMTTGHIPPIALTPEPGAWELADQPDYTPPAPPSKLRNILIPAVASTLIGAIVTFGAMHIIRPEVPEDPAVAAAQADERYLNTLEISGLKTYGEEATKQLFKRYAHHICYTLAVGKVSYADLIQDIEYQQYEASRTSGRPLPIFNYEDARDLTNTAISVYCPQLQPHD